MRFYDLIVFFPRYPRALRAQRVSERKKRRKNTVKRPVHRPRMTQ